jgi:hypothetical protein
VSQSVKGSLAETLFNTIVGFGINYTANILILPRYWDSHHAMHAAMNIGIFFTVISVLRSFSVRRLFNYAPFAAWIDRMNTHLEVPAEWLKTRLASVTSRVRSAVRKTTSRDTTTVTRTASRRTVTTTSDPRGIPMEPIGVLPGEAERPWT